MDKAKMCQVLSDWPDEKQGIGALYDAKKDCYCALGWLGYKGGMTNADLVADGKYDRVREMYNLSVDESDDIWEANDSYAVNGFGTPQEAVLAFLGCTSDA